jgi:hypothetical protein
VGWGVRILPSNTCEAVPTWLAVSCDAALVWSQASWLDCLADSRLSWARPDTCRAAQGGAHSVSACAVSEATPDDEPRQSKQKQGAFVVTWVAAWVPGGKHAPSLMISS